MRMYLCKHYRFRLDMGGLEVFKNVKQLDWQGEFASLEVFAVQQAARIDREHPVLYDGVTNKC